MMCVMMIFNQDLDMDEFDRKLRQQRGFDDSDSDDAISYPKKPPMPSMPKQIEEIQKQLKQSKQPKDEIEEVLNSKNETLKDKKIRELAQRNKQLQVQLQSEKNARQKLEGQINKITKETEEKLGQLGESKKTRPQSATRKTDPLVQSLKGKESLPPKKEETLEEFKQKWKEADKKVQEQRLQIQNLKSEFNKAMRVVQREIGSENVNLDQILGEENGWKGRAQQIEILKSKLLQAQQKLNNTSQYSHISERSEKSTTSTTSEKRQQVMDQMKHQLEQLRTENDLLQSKVKAVSSRKSTLESEIKDIRNEYDKSKKILLEKSDNDDKYIQALKAEIDKLRKTQGSVETRIIYKTRDVEENIQQKETKDDSKVVNNLKMQIQHLREELKRNEAMVQELIQEKLKFSHASHGQSEDPQVIKKLQDEIRALRMERDEFFKTLTKDQDSAKMIKDLTLQNVKLRNKIDELSKK